MKNAVVNFRTLNKEDNETNANYIYNAKVLRIIKPKIN